MKNIATKLPAGTGIMVSASAIYLILMHFLTGLRFEHLLIILLLNGLFFVNGGTRKFVLGFAIFAVFGMLYDIMRVFPNYCFRPVDIAGLYDMEKTWFGISSGAARMTPNEWLAAHHTAAGDLMSGFFYLNWMPVPLAYAAWLFFSKRKLFLHFSLTFLFVNLIGFMIYYLHPAAPPWYVELYGFEFHTGIPGNTAGLARFDELVGIPVFQNIYGRNANVFAALPSLHCAYPVIVLYYSIKSGPGWLRYPATIFMMGIWFAAVYSGHHYIIDAILGIACALAGMFIYEKMLLRTNGYNRFIQQYLRIIS